MFRSALIKSIRTPVLRFSLPKASPAVFINSYRLKTQFQPIQNVRLYSHAPELTKEIITERVIELLEGFDKIEDKSKITAEAHFSKDLNLDSLDIVEVVMALEEEFSISVGDEEADTIKSVQQAIDLIAAQPDSA